MQELAKVQEMLHVKAPGDADAAAPDSAERFSAAVQVRPVDYVQCHGQIRGHCCCVHKDNKKARTSF